MGFRVLVLGHFRHSWVRTINTVAAMAVCIFLFCTIQTVVGAVSWALQSANVSRLVTRHAVSLGFGLPRHYKDAIGSVAGVRSVALTNWFGGTLLASREVASPRSGGSPDFSRFFSNFAVDAEPYLAMYPEYMLPPDQKHSFLSQIRGCVIGRGLANRFGWHIGDTFFLESFLPSFRSRGRPFEFVVTGIYEADLVHRPGTDPNLMFFHYRYLEEQLGRSVAVGTFIVEIAEPSEASAISRHIDSLFENSEAQTQTETELAFRANMISMSGNLGWVLNGVAVAVAFTILLVTANTMCLAFRERRTEIGVLKTLGFSGSIVMALVLGEASVIGALGGGLGLLLSVGAIQALPAIPFVGDAVRAYPHLGLSPGVGLEGLGLAVLISLAAGSIPALLAARANITDMLRAV